MSATIFPTETALRCPDCGRKLPEVPLMKSATLVLKRTCRCKTSWQLKISPSLCTLPGAGSAIISTVEWTRR